MYLDGLVVCDCEHHRVTAAADGQKHKLCRHVQEPCCCCIDWMSRFTYIALRNICRRHLHPTKSKNDWWNLIFLSLLLSTHTNLTLINGLSQMYNSSITQKTERHWMFVMVNVQTIISGHYATYMCVLPPVITCVLFPRKSPPPKKIFPFLLLSTFYCLLVKGTKSCSFHSRPDLSLRFALHPPFWSFSYPREWV